MLTWAGGEKEKRRKRRKRKRRRVRKRWGERGRKERREGYTTISHAFTCLVPSRVLLYWGCLLRHRVVGAGERGVGEASVLLISRHFTFSGVSC